MEDDTLCHLPCGCFVHYYCLNERVVLDLKVMCVVCERDYFEQFLEFSGSKNNNNNYNYNNESVETFDKSK